MDNKYRVFEWWEEFFSSIGYCKDNDITYPDWSTWAYFHVGNFHVGVSLKDLRAFQEPRMHFYFKTHRALRQFRERDKGELFLVIRVMGGVLEDLPLLMGIPWASPFMTLLFEERNNVI